MAAPPADPNEPPPVDIDESDPDHVSYLRALVLKYRFTNKELAYYLQVCPLAFSAIAIHAYAF